MTMTDLGVIWQVKHREDRGAGGGAEEQIGPPLRQLCAKQEHLGEHPGGVRLSQEDGADEPILAYDHLLVDAPRRLDITDDLVLGTGGARLADRNELHAHDLQLADGLGALVLNIGGAAGQMLRRYPGLLIQRRHEAIELPAMLYALTDGVDVRIGGLHLVIHEDSSIHRKSGRPGE